MHHVIFDTDPGVDDAMALYYALAHPQIKLLGITTTFGNVHVGQAAINALYLTQLAGRHLPVTQGVAQPLVPALVEPPHHIHGHDGLGNLPQRQPLQRQLHPGSSARFIVDSARAAPGQVVLVAVGPLGNLATALQLEPELPLLVKEVVVMGGAIDEPGNVTLHAEANIWHDPHAAAAVLAAGWKLTLVGLDVTHRAVVELALFKRVAEHHRHPATDALYHAVAFYSAFYGSRHTQHLARPACYAHDVLAFVALTSPALFRYQSGHLRVQTSGPAIGRTVLEPVLQASPSELAGAPGAALAQVCMGVDAPAVLQDIEQRLLGDWLRPAS